MKQAVRFLCIFFCIPLLQAQEIETSTVPFAVMDQFTLLYPDAKSISWQITDENYQADFKNGKMATMALITSGGFLLETKTQIKISALPEPALTYLAEKIVDKKVEQATIMEDEAGIITFQAVTDKVDYTFDAEGKVLATYEVASAGSRSR